MARPKKDFNKIGDDAASKFLSNTDSEPMDGQIKIDDNVQNEDVQQSAQSVNNINSANNTHNIQNTQDMDMAYNEIKSKRINLLIQPSLLEDVKKIAYISKLSVNEFIIRLVKDYTDQPEQRAKIKKYDEL